MLLNEIRIPMPKKKILFKKRENVTYVYYNAFSFMNKYKKPTSQQIAIGKLDQNTGDLIPNIRFFEYFPDMKTDKINALIKEKEAIASDKLANNFGVIIAQKVTEAFSILTDTRVERNKKHYLLEIIILSVVAVMCGAESYDSIELFGRENINYLLSFLELKNGIPSHDTINRVFQMIKSKQFEDCFVAFTQSLIEDKEVENIIALDGKTVRGSKDTFHKQEGVHLLHAWSVNHGLCLAQAYCGQKGNEITTIPKILDMINIEKSIITIDAIGTQTAIASQIIEDGADYILAVKNNQPNLKKSVHSIFENNVPMSTNKKIEKGHGRIETRICETYNADIIASEKKWRNIKSVIKITSTRENLKGQITKEERFFISSLTPDYDFNKCIRSHWEVENKLHWTLDVTFGEDHQRKRAKNAAKNFSIVRKMALNYLKSMQGNESIKSLRLKLAWRSGKI